MPAAKNAVRRYFDHWAGTYDRDLEASGYAIPAMTAAVLAGRLPSGARVLDVGIGSGLVAQALKDAVPGVHITGVDASGAMLDACARRGAADRLVQMNIAAGQLPAGPFDAVVCTGVIEFMRRPALLLEAMSRALTPGGVLVLAYEPAGNEGQYRPGIVTGIVERTAAFTGIRRARARLPWPDVYMKYLHRPAVIERCLAENGTDAAETRGFIAYHRRGEGDVANVMVIAVRRPE